MEYFAKERPVLANGLGMYVSRAGVAIAAIPSFDIRPELVEVEGGEHPVLGWRLHLMLQSRGGKFGKGYHWVHLEIPFGALEGVLNEFVVDFEQALGKYFGYDFEPQELDLAPLDPGEEWGGKGKREKKGQKEELSLKDLGLE